MPILGRQAGGRGRARAHLQTIIWEAEDRINSPDIDVINFGYELLDNDIPQPLYGPTVLVPPDIHKVVACTCASKNPCAKTNCSCKSSGLSCTSYCNCHADVKCHNIYTVSTAPFEDESEVENM